MPALSEIARRTNGLTPREMHMIQTIEELEAIYGQPTARAVTKEIAYLSEDYQAFVRAAPFVVLATAGAEGTDCSPKGDAPGFVRVIDAHTLAIPDRPGNNRIDNLRNIIRDPRVSLLFIIPGIGETLRVNGRGEISNDPALCASFAVDGKNPKTVITVRVDAVYFHCAKAIVRAKLWDPAQHLARDSLPSPGKILQRLQADFDGDAYDRELPERLRTTLY